MEIRTPFFAPQGWYPNDAEACRREVDGYLESYPGQVKASIAGLVPHAGWRFSGKVAAWTFAALRDVQAELVFIFGGHMHPGARPICMPRGAFGTPLGPIEVHQGLAADLVARFEASQEDSERFNPDNTIELQLPFVKALWPEAKVVAVQVPADARAQEIGQWAARAAQREGLVSIAIGSTDLTHYGANYGFTPRGRGEEAHRWSKEENDKPYLEATLALDGERSLRHALETHSACCPGAASAALAYARERGASDGTLLEHCTSHEVAGGGAPSMWVGYAAVVF